MRPEVGWHPRQSSRAPPCGRHPAREGSSGVWKLPGYRSVGAAFSCGGEGGGDEQGVCPDTLGSQAPPAVRRGGRRAALAAWESRLGCVGVGCPPAPAEMSFLLRRTRATGGVGKAGPKRGVGGWPSPRGRATQALQRESISPGTLAQARVTATPAVPSELWALPPSASADKRGLSDPGGLQG